MISIDQLKIKQVTGKDLKKYLSKLGELRIRVFREYPYLYDGSKEYEREYLQKYVESEHSIAVLIFDGSDLVGCSTAIPLSDESDAFQRPFLKASITPDSVFYCGESVLLKDYRGLGVYKHFFTKRENHAQKLEKFDLIVFCAVVRPDDHPLRPKNYQPLDPVWKKFGYSKNPSLKAKFAWKDLNESEETEKEMVFWTKSL